MNDLNDISRDHAAHMLAQYRPFYDFEGPDAWYARKVRTCNAGQHGPVCNLRDAYRYADEWFDEHANTWHLASRHELEDRLQDIASENGKYAITHWSELDLFRLDVACRALDSAYCELWTARRHALDLGLIDAVKQLDKAMEAASGYSLQMFAGLDCNWGAVFDIEETNTGVETS